MDGVGWYVKDLGTGRGKHADVGDTFQGGGSGSYSLWVRNVGDEPPNGPIPGGVTVQGDLPDHGKESTEALG